MALGLRHFRLLCLSGVIVAAIRLSLTVFGYAKVNRFIRLKDAPRWTRHSPEVLSWAVRHVSRLVPQASCLTQALSLQYLLARSGIGSLVRVGVVGNQDGSFEAHAWLIANGKVMIGGDDEEISRFSPIADLLPK